MAAAPCLSHGLAVHSICGDIVSVLEVLAAEPVDFTQESFVYQE